MGKAVRDKVVRGKVVRGKVVRGRAVLHKVLIINHIATLWRAFLPAREQLRRYVSGLYVTRGDCEIGIDSE